MQRLLIIAMFLGVLAATACSGGGEKDTETTVTLREGDVAPDFSLPGVVGDTVSLQDFRDERSVLLYFSMGSG